jgi:hypothetical protein
VVRPAYWALVGARVVRLLATGGGVVTRRVGQGDPGGTKLAMAECAAVDGEVRGSPGPALSYPALPLLDLGTCRTSLAAARREGSFLVTCTTLALDGVE